MTHTPHTETWTTQGAMTGQVISDAPQYEGQEFPYVVCEGIGNSETAKFIAKAPAFFRLCAEWEIKGQGLQLKVIELKDLLERAWPYLHDLTTCAPALMYGHNEVEKLITEIKTTLQNEQPAPIRPA